MNLKDLTKELDYKLRVWPGGTELAYIDARQAQDLLDEVCWPENWKVEYREIKWELFAWVSIKVWDEWITKWDWWTESKIEKEKWLISDSFKRACVTWWVGRFLYSLKPGKKNEPANWFTATNLQNMKNNLEWLKKKFKTWADLVKEARTNYKVSKEFAGKIEALIK